MTIWERAQKLQDVIDKRHVTWFLGCLALVALVSIWGV